MIEASVEFYTAYLGLQSDLDSLKRNRMGRFKYADLDCLIENIKPILQKHQLALIPSHGQDCNTRQVWLNLALVHAPTAQGITSSVALRAFEFSEYEDQLAGGNNTYQRRYMLMTLLNITFEDDPSDDNGQRMQDRRQYSSATPAPSNGKTISSDDLTKLRGILAGYPNRTILEHNIIKFNKVTSLDQLRDDQLMRVLNYIKDNGTKPGSVGE